MRITDKFVLFFSNKDICSNFYPCNITHNGEKFISSEQLFMYLKAKFFKDEEIAKKILLSKTPKEAKSYGREIKNYNNEIWDKERDNIMLTALSYKFDCVSKFREFLKNNKTKIFVEASPYDSIWGIKLSEDNPDAINPNKWRGENRLGKCINNLIRIKL